MFDTHPTKSGMVIDDWYGSGVAGPTIVVN